MLADGLVEEVRALRDMGCTKDMVSMQGLGYKEIYRIYKLHNSELKKTSFAIT